MKFPDFTFPPINLYTMPKIQTEYKEKEKEKKIKVGKMNEIYAMRNKG